MDEPYHVVVEVENPRCKVLKELESAGVQHFKVTDIRGSVNGLTRHLVEFPSDQVERIRKGRRLRASSRLEVKPSTWVESEGCDVCNTILSQGSFLISGRTIQNYNFMYSFIAPGFEAYKKVISTLEEEGYKVKVLRLWKFESRRETLTRRQEKVLWLALKAGFFEFPRKVNTVELSRLVGLSPPALSETMRRGMRRVLEQYFET
ncbi:MAG: helix-turn-helix domain-containing protein [Candidatus Bathyarchaeia archaeon]